MTDRVVFDTNILIAGLLWRGAAYRSVLLAQAGVVQALYCDQALAELAEKLRDKFRFDPDRIRATMFQIRQYAERVEIEGTLRVVPADPDDDVFVECASTGKAQWLVSEDRHLLALGSYQTIRVVNAQTFLTQPFSGE